MSNPRIRRLSLAVIHALGAGLAVSLAAGPAAAQQPAQRERIEVTGSNIKRIEGETALPVTVIIAPDIERMGATTTEDILKRITSSTAMYSDSTQGVGYAVSNANLRGIGASSRWCCSTAGGWRTTRSAASAASTPRRTRWT